jgi:hypothetical protein
VFIFSTIDNQEFIYLSFYIQFFKQHVNIALQHVLTFVIERKIALARDACSRPPISLRSRNLHVGDIRRAVSEITSYHRRGNTFSLLWFLHAYVSFGLSLTFLFVFHVMVSTINFYWIFVSLS